MQTIADIFEGLRALREHSVLEEALQSVEQQAGGEEGPAFLQALLKQSPQFIEIWGVWHAQSKQGTISVTIALLKALRSLLMVPLSHSDHEHSNTGCAWCELHQFAQYLLSTELPVCYRFLSSGDVEKASETMQLLTAAVARSPAHCMMFLSNFNFTFPALPKLAYRPSKKSNGQKEAPVFPGSEGNDKAEASSHNTYDSFFNLALAVLRTCPSGAGLSKALQAPQLLPLALQQLAYVDTAACHLMCEALATRISSPGDRGSANAFAAILRGKVLHQLVLLASNAPPVASQGQHPSSKVEMSASDSAHLRKKCSELAAAILHAAALSKHLGLWTATDGLLCSMQPVAQHSTCLPRCMFSSSAGLIQQPAEKHSKPVEQQPAAASVSNNLLLQRAPLDSFSGIVSHLPSASKDTKRSTSSQVQCFQDDDVQSGLYCECKLQCKAAAVMQPRKALQGLASQLQFAASSTQLHLLLDMIKLSPALAAVVLGNRELMPLTVDSRTARVRSQVAVACFSSLSQLASPAHQALATANEQLQSMKQPGGNVELGLKSGLFTSFLHVVFPDSLSKASFSKVLEGGSPEHIRAALDILSGQLRCVWRVTAALRHQRRLCSGCKTSAQHDFGLSNIGAETVTNAEHKHESCSEQVERASAVVARVLKSKLPDAGVLHRVLLALFPVLSCGAFEASGAAFPCVKEASKNSTGKATNTDGGAQKEAQGVRMNIDGMRLQLEDDSEDSSSDDEAGHVMTPKEAEALSVLVLQALPVECAENGNMSASWSAAFLTPVLQHMLECEGGSEDRALCETIVYNCLCHVQLHHSPDTAMLPWVLPSLQSSNADHQVGATSQAALRSESAAAIASFFVSMLTACARRPHLPWSALTAALAAHSSQETQGATNGDASADTPHTHTVAPLCTEAAHSGFVLLFSTVTAAMGRFRSQMFVNQVSDSQMQRSSLLVEEAVWKFVADTTTSVLHTLHWSSAAAGVLLGAVISEIEGNSDRLKHVLHLSWEHVGDCMDPSGGQGQRVQGERCTLKMSHAVPAAFKTLIQDLWQLSSTHSAHDPLQGSCASSSKAVALTGKRKASNGIPSSAVTLRKRRSMVEFAVEQTHPGSALQHATALTADTPAAMLSLAFGTKQVQSVPCRSQTSLPLHLNSELQTCGASWECQALMSLHGIIQTCWHSSAQCDAAAVPIVDVGRVFVAVQELPDTHVEFLMPSLLRSIAEYCTGLQQQLTEPVKAPASKCKKTGNERASSGGSTAASPCCRHVAAAMAAVGVCAAYCRPGLWKATQGHNKSSVTSAARLALSAATHVNKASVREQNPADQAVHALCLAAVTLAAAFEDGALLTAAAAVSQITTRRADPVLNVAEISQVVANAASCTQGADPGSEDREDVRRSIESQFGIQDEQVAAHCRAEQLQGCCTGMVDAAQHALSGTCTPATFIMYKAGTALLESQHWEVLAEALKEVCARVSLYNLQSACDKGISAMLLLGKACICSADVAHSDSFDLSEGLPGHIEAIYSVYDCACQMLTHSKTYSTAAMQSAITFLSAFWGACAPDAASSPLRSVMLGAWQPVGRASSLQMVDDALLGHLPSNLVSAAAFIISSSTTAALHAAKRFLTSLSSDASMSTMGLDSLTVGVHSPLACAVLAAALMHEHIVPELFAAGQQIAAAIRPRVLRVLTTAASDGTLSETCHLWENQEVLAVLAEACFSFHPLQVDKAQSFVTKVLPPEGMNLASGSMEHHNGASLRLCSGCVSFASRIVASAAQAVDVHSVPHKSAMSRHRDLVSAPLPRHQASVLAHSFLSFCVNTISQTLKVLLQEFSTEPGTLEYVAAAFALLDPVFAAIDECLGDLIASQPVSNVESDSFKGIAQCATTHTSSALASMRLGHPWQHVSASSVKSARRLWAALIQQDNSAMSGLEGGRDAIGTDAVSKDAQCQSDEEMKASQDDLQHSTGTIAVDENKGGAHNCAKDGATSDCPLAGAGAGCNVDVAKSAIAALGLIMESDEAMALLFNISAIQLRCSLPEHVSRVNIPLKSVVMLADSDTVALNAALSTSEENSVIKYGGISNATHARLREELLLLIETLVCCTETHIPELHAEDAATRKARSVEVRLHRAAQLLLPQLLKTYQATMMAEDRACLLAIKALDRVLSTCGTSSTGQDVTRGFLESTGFMWGSLWEEVHSWSSMHPVLLAGLLCRSDMVDPRRLALSALHFAGSRTLSLDEEDPFHSASGLSRTSHAAYCAYDPAFVVPAAAAMLQQGWVAAESVVRAGWMPLLLRCLGADDDRLREAAYSAIAYIEGSLRQQQEALQEEASSFREARQLLALLEVVRNSVEAPYQKLPRASVVFLAEASVAALNPAASVYSHLNRFLMKRASLQLHGVPMLGMLHGGLVGVAWHSQSLARELAIAATVAVSHNVKVAADALASPDSLAASGAVIRGVLAASQSPTTCSKMLHKGVLTHVAAIVSQSLGAIAAASQGDGKRSGLNHDSILRKDVVLAALSALITFSRVNKLWRAEILQESAAEYSSVLWSLLYSTSSFVSRVAECTEQTQAGNTMPCWQHELVDAILMKLLHLARAVSVQSRAWEAEQAASLSLTPTFWTAILHLSSIQSHTPCLNCTCIVCCQRNALRECLLCLPAESLTTLGLAICSRGTASKPQGPPSHSRSLPPDDSLWPILLHDFGERVRGNTHLGQFSDPSDACSVSNAPVQRVHTQCQDNWYRDSLCASNAAEHTAVRWLAWTMSAILQQAASNTEQPCVTPWRPFAGQHWVRDVLCYAGASTCMTGARGLGASVKAGYVTKLALTMEAVVCHWQSYVSADDSALGHTIQGNVGGRITWAATALGAVAAGVQSLTDAWEQGLNLQTVDGSVPDDMWTVGTVVLCVCQHAQALDT